jgi:hypothetical protein
MILKVNVDLNPIKAYQYIQRNSSDKDVKIKIGNRINFHGSYGMVYPSNVSTMDIRN